MMTQNAIVLSVAPYRITNDKGVLENEGCTVRYIMTEDLSPVDDKTNPNQPSKGYKPAKATIPYNDFDKFNTVPALYELAFTMKVASDGSTTLTPTGFKFLSGISINKVTAPIKP